MSKSTNHIVFVVKYFPTVSETFIVNQINGLLDAGVKVDLYAYVKVNNALIHNSLSKHDLLSKVNYFIKPPESKLKRLLLLFKWSFKNFTKIKWNLLFKTLNFFKYGKQAYTLNLFYESQWFLVLNNINLIHAHFGMNGNRIAKLKALGIIPKSTKLINTFHGYDLSPEKFSSYIKRYNHLFQQADAFTVNTPYLENILKPLNIENKPCYILPVGLDTTYFQKNSTKNESAFFDVIFCGKFIALKGPDLAILTIQKLRDLGHLNARLHLIGDGPMEEQLQSYVQKNNLSDIVFFYGKQSQDDVKLRLEQADVFLFPGRHDQSTGRAETQGLVVQEAQAMSLPVIVSDVGGIKYGILPNKSGFVVKENNIDGFVNAIQQFILNPNKKIEFGKNGRGFVVDNYDNKMLTKQLLSIYKKCNSLIS